MAHGCAGARGSTLTENVPRVLRAGLGAVLDRESWPRPPVYDWLEGTSAIEGAEMLRTFNCGIGFVLVVSPDRAGAVREAVAPHADGCHEIGRIEAAPGAPAVRYA